MQYIVVIILLIIFLILLGSHSMAIQRFAAMELVLLTVVAGAYFYICQNTVQRMESQYMLWESKNLERDNTFSNGLDELDLTDEQVQDEIQAELDEVLQNNLLYAESDSGKNYVGAAILETTKDGYTRAFVMGEDADFANHVNQNEALTSVVDEAVRLRTVSYSVIQHEYGVLAIADTNANIPQRVLCVEVPLTQVQQSADAMQEQSLFLGLLVWAIGTFIIWLIVFLQDREWKRMLHAMSVISVGKEEWKKPKIRSNEMQNMWNSLNEVVRNVARINYEKYKMFQVYYRFAPKQMEKILQKSSITDVVNGDVAEVNGVLVLASLSGNPNQLRQAYTQSMNYKFMLLSQYQKEQNGILLSGDSDLRMLKYMFLEESEQAVRFGVDALTAFEEKGIYQTEQALILMHKSDFTYGITGDEEQALSYIVSDDLNLLQTYAGSLRNLGIRMVVTDSMLPMLSGQYSYRYIGYVGEKECAFKLYEILDVYPQRERRMRLAADAKLQQGIKLYYRDDFYLARSAFTDALRECPNDGLAKWYLFECENRLNHPESEEASYGLFAGGSEQ